MACSDRIKLTRDKVEHIPHGVPDVAYSLAVCRPVVSTTFPYAHQLLADQEMLIAN